MVSLISKNPKILIDTREQQPFSWAKNHLGVPYGVVTTVDTLPYGDYSLYGHDQPGDDNSIIVEKKKNSSELLGNVGTNWDRFQEEARGLAQYKNRLILVCGPPDFDTLYHKGFTQLNPNFVLKRLAQLQSWFGIPTIFMWNREIAENYLYRLFRETLEKTTNEN